MTCFGGIFCAKFGVIKRTTMTTTATATTTTIQQLLQQKTLKERNGTKTIKAIWAKNAQKKETKRTRKGRRQNFSALPAQFLHCIRPLLLFWLTVTIFGFAFNLVLFFLFALFFGRRRRVDSTTVFHPF